MNILTEKDLLETRCAQPENDRGENLAILLAQKGKFKNLPQHCITKRVLLLNLPKSKDKLIHLLTRTSQFEFIPKSILTEEILSTKGKLGESVYHLLSNQNNIALVPAHLLTKKALTLGSNDLFTPLHRIAQYSPDLIPEHIGPKELSLRSRSGLTPLHIWASGLNWTSIPNDYITKKKLSSGDKTEYILLGIVLKRFEQDIAFTLKIAKKSIPKIKSIFSKLDELQLKKLIAKPDTMPSARKYAKQEILKRKILSQNPTGNIEI